MAARLTDRQRKMIMADRANEMSIRQLADKYHVSTTTIQRVLKNNTEVAQMVTQKKKENTLDMLAFMDSRKEKMQEAIDLHLKALTDPKKIEAAALLQVSTSFGIIVDKATRNTASNNDSLNKLDNLLKEFRDAVKPEAD